jgi:hypothetical protein
MYSTPFVVSFSSEPFGALPAPVPLVPLVGAPAFEMGRAEAPSMMVPPEMTGILFASFQIKDDHNRS